MDARLGAVASAAGGGKKRGVTMAKLKQGRSSGQVRALARQAAAEAGEAGEGGGKQREETIVVDGGGGRNIWGLTPATGACSSTQPGDVDEASCAGWCQAEQAAEHCRWCKCRGCLRLADACSDDLWIHRKEYPNDPACVGPCASQSD